jgi:hypothetical protein
MNERTLEIPPFVVDGISREVLTAFDALPRRGAEAGGLLLGYESAGLIDVQDFEPALCEYRFGPSFDLSNDDILGLQESINWFTNPANGFLGVVGAYLSRTRLDDAFQRDEEFMRRFLWPGSVLLRLEPERNHEIMYELFMFRSRLWTAADPHLFLPGSKLTLSLRDESEADSAKPEITAEPSDPIPDRETSELVSPSVGQTRRLRATPFLSEYFLSPALAAHQEMGSEESPIQNEGTPTELEVSSHEPSSPAPTAPVTDPPLPSTKAARAIEQPPSPPTTAAILNEPAAPPSGTPRVSERPFLPIGGKASWAIAAGAAILIGAALGYYSFQPPQPRATSHPVHPAPESAKLTRAEAEPVSPPVVNSADREVQADTSIPGPAELRQALEGWRRAVLSGDTDRIIECYAQKVERYFNLQNATREDVRRTVVNFLSGRGTVSDLQISALGITSVEDNRIAATFRKRWQTAGRHPSSGEERERLTFAKISGSWRIVREEELRVFWTRRGSSATKPELRR